MQRLRLAYPAAPSHEDVFVERYERLLAAATALTAGDREAARDLVHDAYLQFVLAQPPIDPIERIDGYLFITIRNLHISRVRRTVRARHESLSVLDFDSAAIGLRVLPAARRVEAIDELRWIRDYALERRLALRAASAFLLHYFLDYRPSEIASVLKNPVAIVHKLLHVARADVQRALQDCPSPSTGRLSDADDLDALRDAVFHVPAGTCPRRSHLAWLYSQPGPVDVTLLAHLVSCRACLDRVNAITGLPRLSDRTGDRDGRRQGRGGPGPTVGSGPREVASRLDTRDVPAAREHRPKELRIAVNGLPVGMQRVAGPQNEQIIRLNAHEPVTFVEVFSEQDVRLLLLNAESIATGAARQVACVALSDGRQLEAELDLSDLCPTVRIAYRDPLFTEIERVDESAAERAQDVALPQLMNLHISREDGRPTMEDVPHVRGTGGRIACVLDRVLRLVRPDISRRRALQIAAAAIAVWLLFFTPGTPVSAAELAFRTLVRIAVETWRWVNPPIVPPSVSAPVTREPRGNAPIPRPAKPAMRVPSSLRSWGPVERSRAELLALAQLQRVEAYLGQEVQLRVGQRGRARVEAVVGDERRRDELLAALGRLAKAQPLEMQVLTTQQLALQHGPADGRSATSGEFEGTGGPGAPAVRLFEFARDDIGVAAILREQLGTDQAMREFANAILARSQQASQHAWALHYVGQRFPAPVVASLSTADRDVLARIVEYHAREFDHHVEMMSTALSPMFGIDGLDGAAASTPDGPTFWDLASRLLELNRTRDEAIRRAFVVGSAAGRSLDVRTPAFWQATEASRRVAQRLRREPGLFQH